MVCKHEKLGKSQMSSWYIQPFTRYLRQTLVLYETEHYGKNSISIFQQIFPSIEKIFILGVKLVTRL